MPTIKDIAEELNVSTSLVSKVLNNRLGTTMARQETIEAIHDQARKMGYRRNLSATALRTGRQHAIGVFIHRLGQPGAGLVEAMIEGVTTEAQRSQHRLMLHICEDAEEFRRLQKQLHVGMVDGLVIAGMRHRGLREAATALREQGLSMVTVHEEALDPAIVNVGLSQVEIGRMATAHLIERGCRRIAHVHQSTARHQGYQQALAEAGLGYDPALVYAPPRALAYTAEAGEQAVAHWLAESVGLDGLFADSDEQSMGALNELLRRGVAVPERVRLIGVDDAPYCRLAAVPLSSVCQRFRERGQEAVRMLLARPGRGGRKAAQAEPAPELAPRLCVRASSA